MNASPLLDHFARLVEKCKPNIVFVENVPGLQKLDASTEPFGGFLRRLNNAGYEVEYRSITLAKYGIPQRRRRSFLSQVGMAKFNCLRRHMDPERKTFRT